jgi:hypothetical protein
MDRVLFFLCALVLAATPAQAGNGVEGKPERPVVRPPAPREVPLPQPRVEVREEDNASTGPSAPERRSGTDLGFEAEKEEEAWQKRRRTAPLKGR